MLAAERQNQILQKAKLAGTVRTTDLAHEFDVTEETIRRDLDRLAKQGLLARTHGGALIPDLARRDLPQTHRQAQQTDEKKAIATYIAKFILPNETIAFDASSTSLHCAMSLPKDMGLRVVTNSLPIAQELAPRADIELILVGGQLDTSGRCFYGLLTDSSIDLLAIDRFFFSGKGLHPEQGISEANAEQARLKRKLIRQSGWSCALLDNTKLGVKSAVYFAGGEDFDTLVTDEGGIAWTQKHLKESAYDIAIAPLIYSNH